MSRPPSHVQTFHSVASFPDSEIFPSGLGERHAPGARVKMLLSRASVQVTGGENEVAAARGEIEKLAESQHDAARARFRLIPKNDKIEKALQILIASNPTEAPGRWDSEEKTARLANGQWRVLYAPHMYILQQVCIADTRWSQVATQGWDT